MTAAGALDRGREAFARQAWGDAYMHLSAADLEAPLELEDLERLARAADLTGRGDVCSEALARAHHESLRMGETARAVRNAFWLGMSLVNRGEMVRGGGWLARARRLLDESRLDCVEQGYMLVPFARQTLEEGDPAAADAMFEQAGAVAERFHDPDLATLARLGRGTSRIALGETARGVALLDEAMVAVTAREVSPIVIGIVYCGAIEAFQGILDLRRAQEWTDALGRWVDSQPDLVPFRGQCLLHRAELLHLHGAWREAADEARRATDRLSHYPAGPVLGAALYQQAELHRLRGEFGKAEEDYREASRQGRAPEPGLALLRLAQGRIGAAEAAIRRSLDESGDGASRPRLLEACVEIALAAGDLEAARAAAGELAEVAEQSRAVLLAGMAARARGAVRLAEGDVRSALEELRRAFRSWQDLGAPYEAARVRTLIAAACGALGDDDATSLELDAARGVFRQLGAAPDLAQLDALDRRDAALETGGLTAREVEVLRLVAAGGTNRAIATELVISEKTVARHVSNIFTKLGLSSRSAATAYAYRHGLS